MTSVLESGFLEDVLDQGPKGTMNNTICINGRFLGQRVTGVQRYGRELLRELDALLSDRLPPVRVEVLIPRNVTDVPDYGFFTVRKVGVLTGHAWEQIELPLYCHSHLLFTPSPAAPLLYARNVVTIHDAAVFAAPGGYSFRYRLWYRLLGKLLCRRSLKVITVSEFSKQELVRWCRAQEEGIVVIYEGSEHVRVVSPEVEILKRCGLESLKYVLAVGSSNPNKNFDGIVRALPYLQNLDMDIAIAGNTDHRVFRSAVRELNGVKALGYVRDEELCALYRNAACFVFPSFYEGFGLPPLEAIAVGCPVVVSNVASMPELFRDMAVFCNPHDPKDIAEKILGVVRSAVSLEDRTALSSKASRFSWKRCAQETWDVLEHYSQRQRCARE